jgi:tagatose 1,6-diphosphate aldolase GatY/KbaY
MTLVNGIEALAEARGDGRAVLGFSIYNLEQGLAVVAAAEELDTPIILQAGSSAFGYAGREALAGLALGLARDAPVAVGVHLDHCTDLEEISQCLELGYTSVMFDGSALSLEENVLLTREVVTRAHRAGAWVEAELVGIAGNEDASAPADAAQLTDPHTAAQFVAATGVDALAVAVGNVHGMATRPPRLDFDRLREIADAVALPLVLHGVSGLPEPDVATAVDLGVAKLNLNAELRQAFLSGVTSAPPPDEDSVAAFMASAIDATKGVALAKLRSFSVRSAAATKAV